MRPSTKISLGVFALAVLLPVAALFNQGLGMIAGPLMVLHFTSNPLDLVAAILLTAALLAGMLWVVHRPGPVSVVVSIVSVIVWCLAGPFLIRMFTA